MSWRVTRRSAIQPVTNFPRRSTLDGRGGRITGMAEANYRDLEKLESNLAHLEHQVEQLNSVVIEQGKLLERLKKEVQRTSNAMQTLELERIQANIQKPPHYQ